MDAATDPNSKIDRPRVSDSASHNARYQPLLAIAGLTNRVGLSSNPRDFALQRLPKVEPLGVTGIQSPEYTVNGLHLNWSTLTVNRWVRSIENVIKELPRSSEEDTALDLIAFSFPNPIPANHLQNPACGRRLRVELVVEAFLPRSKEIGGCFE